jgi:hypothetical protein
MQMLFQLEIAYFAILQGNIVRQSSRFHSVCQLVWPALGQVECGPHTMVHRLYLHAAITAGLILLDDRVCANEVRSAPNKEARRARPLANGLGWTKMQGERAG